MVQKFAKEIFKKKQKLVCMEGNLWIYALQGEQKY
jgi:hypothetical protein